MFLCVHERGEIKFLTCGVFDGRINPRGARFAELRTSAGRRNAITVCRRHLNVRHADLVDKSKEKQPVPHGHRHS